MAKKLWFSYLQRSHHQLTLKSPHPLRAHSQKGGKTAKPIISNETFPRNLLLYSKIQLQYSEKSNIQNRLISFGSVIYSSIRYCCSIFMFMFSQLLYHTIKSLLLHPHSYHEYVGSVVDERNVSMEPLLNDSEWERRKFFGK